jgi:hypothetical protein
VVAARAFDEPRGGADQHQPLRRMSGFEQGFGHPRLDVGAEGEAGQRHRQIAVTALRFGQHGEQVVGLTLALVVRAFALTDAAESSGAARRSRDG